MLHGFSRRERPPAGGICEVVTGTAWARLIKSRTGTAAVEFAMLVVPFFALLFLVFNTALIYFAQQTLQTATSQAARLIMTGQAQGQGMTANQFHQTICANATVLFNCGNIFVNVQTFSSFTSVSMLNPIQNGTFNTGHMAFSLGNSGDIEVVQVFYQWPIFATMFGPSGMSGTDLLVATAAFRNEPF
jgi:Flp pilus assembly protein TadG